MVFIDVGSLSNKIVSTKIDENMVYEHFENENDELLYELRQYLPDSTIQILKGLNEDKNAKSINNCSGI